jgi:katanin p60 ATPase-containing subunit A1
MAARKKIKGLSAEAIKQMQKEEMDLPVTKADFEEAVSKIQPSVNKTDIEKYEKWMAEYGST